MIVDLKVHVEIVQYKGCQGSNMRPPAKDKRGVRERFAKQTFLFAKNGHLQIKESGLITIHTYIYI